MDMGEIQKIPLLENGESVTPCWLIIIFRSFKFWFFFGSARALPSCGSFGATGSRCEVENYPETDSSYFKQKHFLMLKILSLSHVFIIFNARNSGTSAHQDELMQRRARFVCLAAGLLLQGAFVWLSWSLATKLNFWQKFGMAKVRQIMGHGLSILSNHQSAPEAILSQTEPNEWAQCKTGS